MALVELFMAEREMRKGQFVGQNRFWSNRWRQDVLC